MSVTDLEPMSHRSLVIEPPRGWSRLGLGELWQHRDLLYFLTWRDIKVRYAQASMGIAWAVLQPLLMMVIFTIFLGRLAKVPSAGLPYPVFALSGLVPWTYFANAVTSSTESLTLNANVVSKVYFPRLLVPFAALLSWLPDLAIATVLLVALMLIYGIVPAATIVLLPVFALFAVLAAASVGTWLSALNVSYRDVRYAVPFVIQLWLFATPVVYPATLVPKEWRALYGLNPMAGVVEGFRWALFGNVAPMWGLMAVSLAVTLALFVGGLYWFRKVEHRFSDVI
jgi:lipopolysaccharide transport system permease protein